MKELHKTTGKGILAPKHEQGTTGGKLQNPVHVCGAPGALTICTRTLVGRKKLSQRGKMLPPLALVRGGNAETIGEITFHVARRRKPRFRQGSLDIERLTL